MYIKSRPGPHKSATPRLEQRLEVRQKIRDVFHHVLGSLLALRQAGPQRLNPVPTKQQINYACQATGSTKNSSFSVLTYLRNVLVEY